MSVRPGAASAALSAVLTPRVTLAERVLPARVLGTVTLAAVLLLVGGLAGAVASLPAVAVAVLAAAAPPGLALVYLGYAIRLAKWRAPAGSPPLAPTACRCAGLLGLGALTGGFTVAGLPLVAPEHRDWLAGLGLTAAAALYAIALLEVPGIRGSRTARLRVALDGVSAGLLIALVGWLLVPDQVTRHPIGYVSAMVAAACVAITVATLLRAYRRPDAGTRALVVRCGGGAVLTVVGLALLVVAGGLVGWSGPPVAPQPARLVLFVAAALAVCGPPLVWAGARRVPGQPEAADLDERTGGYPMLALPLAALTMAIAHHLAGHGLAGHTVMLLAMVISGVLSAREILVATNLRRWVRRLTAQEAQQRQLVADLRRQRELEREVRLLATTDQLTGLPNQRELLRAASGRYRGALIVVGLQGLQAISDLRGHAARDAVLTEAARRLRAHTGPDHLVARLEGSRFAVVTGSAPIEAYGLAVGLMAALATSYQLPGRPVSVPASAGLAAFDPAGGRDEALHQAELALRRAYQLGRNQVEWYDDGLREQLVRRLDLERHLPGAAGRGELDLAFQPVAELDGERPVGVEALLRWRHPVLGRVLPGELIPVADQVRVGGEIGDWVLHTACRWAATWRRAGHDLWLGINVSARQLAGREFVSGLAVALSVHQIPPERLTIEIAASQIHAELPTVASQLGKVRGLGVRTALDQVGATGTDLAWLRRLPLDMVKLATPQAAQSSTGLAAGVVDLSRRLGLAVVAAQLEAEDQRELVRAAGCRFGQGYLIVPPAPADRFTAYLDAVRDLQDVEPQSAGTSYE